MRRTLLIKLITVTIALLMIIGYAPVTATYAFAADANTATAEIALSDAIDPTEHVHNYTSRIKKKPTCRKTGTMEYKCVCGDTYTEAIEMLPHKYVKKKYRSATCKKTGKYRYKCKVCSYKYYEYTPKLEHTPKYKKGVIYCTKCKSKIKVFTRGERNEMARNEAVQWAIDIANDNSFHYGKEEWAHHNGCYFCGTNTSKNSPKLKDGASPEECRKTYCCNPFVTAAYCHGAGAPEVDCKVNNKRFGLANDRNIVLKDTKTFKYIEKPASFDSLLPGDILLTPTHCMLYAGNGKIVHASHHDDGIQDSYWDDSIKSANISASQWSNVTKIYRYLGTGKF